MHDCPILSRHDFQVDSNNARSLKNLGTDKVIRKDFSYDKASFGNAWKSPFPLTVHLAIISFPINASWARRTANLVNFFLSTNLGYFSITNAGEISLDLSIGGSSWTTSAGETVGVFLPLFVISDKVGVDNDISRAVAVIDEVGVTVADVNEVGVAGGDTDDIGVTDLDVGVGINENGW